MCGYMYHKSICFFPTSHSQGHKVTYCKLVIIRHLPIFAIFVKALRDKIMYG